MPSVRIRRPGAAAISAAAAAAAASSPPPQGGPSAEASSSSAAAPPARRPSRAAGKASREATAAFTADSTQPGYLDGDDADDAGTGPSSALTSVDTPIQTDVEAGTQHDQANPASELPTPAKRGPGRPRGSGRPRGRPRGSGRTSSALQDHASMATTPPADQQPLRLRRSVAGLQGIDTDSQLGPSTSRAQSDDADDNNDDDDDDDEEEVKPTLARRGRGRPSKAKANALSGTATPASPPAPPRNRGGRKSLVVRMESGDADSRASASRPSRKRKRSVDDDDDDEDGDDAAHEDGAEEDDEDDQSDSDEDEDEDEEQDATDATSATRVAIKDLPPLKKRPSRMNGYKLAFENHQTTLWRPDESEPDETRAKKKQRRGRKARSGLPRTRIIEDSEDENSEDDRPRPKAPEDDTIDEDRIVPLNERLKVKVMGQVYMMDGDELELPSDPDGDKKVDRNGNPLGDREWKAPSFTSSLRGNPNKVYFLSVDAARAVGYRDSLTFFRSDLRLIKLSLIQQEKDDLIAAGRLKEQLRTRNVTVVAARSVYKVHGAKCIKGGRAVVDDYYESAAREKLESSGKSTTAGQVLPEEDTRTANEIKRQTDRERDRSRRPPDAVTVATNDHQGQVVLTTFGDNGASPFMRSVNHISRRMAQQRADLTEVNWMMEMAQSVRGMNQELEQYRRDRVMQFRHQDVVYEEAGVDARVVGEDEEDEDDEEDANSDAEARAHRNAARKAQATLTNHTAPPVGLYEPTSNLPHYLSSTQPTTATLEKVSERPVLGQGDAVESAASSNTKPVLGGTKIGSGAWGVMSWDTAVALDPRGGTGMGPPQAQARLPAGTGGE